MQQQPEENKQFVVNNSSKASPPIAMPDQVIAMKPSDDDSIELDWKKTIKISLISFII